MTFVPRPSNPKDAGLASSKALITVVWPKVQIYMGGGKLIETESRSDDLRAALDYNAGVDALQQLPDRSLRSIASRVQWYDPDSMLRFHYPPATFTRRLVTKNGSIDTEVRKRESSIENRTMLPAITMQAYLSDGGSFCSCGWCDTEQLYKAVKWKIPKRYRNADGTIFDVVKWADLQDVGVMVSTVGVNLPPLEPFLFSGIRP